nr:coiled-coil domain-containing protein 171-like [Zonotrichia albicollis]
MDPVEHLRLKVHNLEEKNLELNNQHNQEVSHCEKEVMNLRSELEKGEVLRRDLQSEMSLARKMSEIQLYSAEDKLSDVKSKLLELQALNDKYQQKEAETAEMIQSSQWQWQEEQRRFAVDRDNILREYLGRMEFLIKEKAERERACKETNAALNSIARKLRDMEAEQDACSKIVKLQAKCLDFKNTRQEYLIKELEAETVKIKKLEEDAAAARLAHMQCKSATEIMQLRIQELEGALNEEQRGRREAFSGVSRKDFRESENAHERGKKV